MGLFPVHGLAGGRPYFYAGGMYEVFDRQDRTAI